MTNQINSIGRYSLGLLYIDIDKLDSFCGIIKSNKWDYFYEENDCQCTYMANVYGDFWLSLTCIGINDNVFGKIYNR